MDTQWPDPNFHIGQREHLHALGVIIATYNLLEFALFIFFKNHVVRDSASAQKIFAYLPLPKRIEAIRIAAANTVTDSNLRADVNYFLDAFKIIEKNRNFLAHSHTMLNTSDQLHLTFGKGSRSGGNWTFAHMELRDLRQVADDTKLFWLFGSHLCAFLEFKDSGGFNDTFTLKRPKRPSMPMQLQETQSGVKE